MSGFEAGGGSGCRPGLCAGLSPSESRSQLGAAPAGRLWTHPDRADGTVGPRAGREVAPRPGAVPGARSLSPRGVSFSPSVNGPRAEAEEPRSAPRSCGGGRPGDPRGWIAASDQDGSGAGRSARKPEPARSSPPQAPPDQPEAPSVPGAGRAVGGTLARPGGKGLALRRKERLVPRVTGDCGKAERP